MNREEATAVMDDYWAIKDLMSIFEKFGVVKNRDYEAMYEIYVAQLLPYLKEEQIASMVLQDFYEREARGK